MTVRHNRLKKIYRKLIETGPVEKSDPDLLEGPDKSETPPARALVSAKEPHASKTSSARRGGLEHLGVFFELLRFL